MTSLSQARQAKPTVYRFDDFTLDWGSRLLLRNGVPQHLSPKAQHLLHMLLWARPNAVSRQDLFDKLWPSTFVVESNLASLVNELRRALGDNAQTPKYIRTVHGYGYAFHGSIATEAVSARIVAAFICEHNSFQLPGGAHVIGRAPDARIMLMDRTVSRHHARLLLDDDQLQIEDLGSKNGTWVDGRRISTPTPLSRRSRIEIGGVTAVIAPHSLSDTQSLTVDLSGIKRQIAELIA